MFDFSSAAILTASLFLRNFFNRVLKVICNRKSKTCLTSFVEVLKFTCDIKSVHFCDKNLDYATEA